LNWHPIINGLVIVAPFWLIAGFVLWMGWI
jgi:hypothetical protein